MAGRQTPATTPPLRLSVHPANPGPVAVPQYDFGSLQGVLGHEVEDHLPAHRGRAHEAGQAPHVGQAELRDMPLPPWVWMAWSRAARAASAAAYLAKLAASPASRPGVSHAQAAFWVMSRASSTSILALANGWEMPWWRPIGRAPDRAVPGVGGGFVQGVAADAVGHGRRHDALGIEADEHLAEPVALGAESRSAGTSTSSKNKVNCFSGATISTGMSVLSRPGAVEVDHEQRQLAPAGVPSTPVRVTTSTASALVARRRCSTWSREPVDVTVPGGGEWRCCGSWIRRRAR